MMTGELQDATWWHERNEQLRGLPGVGSASLLPDHVCELLDDVEAVFVTIGADTPGWEGRPVERSPAPEEYSRCLDPGKFRIIQARVDAWVDVLVERRWAQVSTERSSERRGSHEYLQAAITLRPEARSAAGGAIPLTFRIYDSTDPETTLNVEVLAGDPPVGLAEVPGCGCDACDSGSAHLLEELDQWALSVVDGSLVVDPSAQLQVRNSFGGHGVGERSGSGSTASAAFTAAPWATGWTSLPVTPGENLPLPQRTERGPRAIAADLLRDLFRRLRGRPRPDQGWTMYSPVDRG